MALINKLENIGNAIRNKTGKTEPMTLDEMVNEIENIKGGESLPEELTTITGNCQYKFAGNGWNAFFEKYKNQLSTKDITDFQYMFYENKGIEEIPFDLNGKDEIATNCQYMFDGMTNLVKVPNVKGFSPINIAYLFHGCWRLREIPEDAFAEEFFKDLDGSRSSTLNRIFYQCYSLRKIPSSFLKIKTSSNSSSNGRFYYGFYYCYVLDEISDLGLSRTTLTSNHFSNTFGKCGRLKKVTFETENGEPIKLNWTKQTIDLSDYVGYVYNTESYVTGYNSGLTTDTQVKTQEDYERLKDNPDYWTMNINYARYNHDSAVETINSLPDVSQGNTNVIKFKGDAGKLTDGGAINTLTEEELAIATAKGWTVTLV